MINESTYHLINDYLAGNLQGIKLDKFKADIKNDAGLHDALMQQTAIVQAIEQARENDLKALLAGSRKKTSVFKIGPITKWALASAAAIALIAVVLVKISPLIGQWQSTNSQAENIDDPNHTTDHITFSDIDSNQTALIDSQTLAMAEPTLEQSVENEKDERPNNTVAEEEEESLEDMDLAANQTTAAPKVDNIDVAKDQLLSTKNYVVLSINPNFGEVEESAGRVLNEVETTSNKKRKKRRDRNKENNEINDSEKIEDIQVSEQKLAEPYTKKQLQVEYWKSIVNYKGYKYTNGKLQVYGVMQHETLNFKELDDRLYVKMGGKQYFIEKNNKHNRMVEVTNPTLLKVLND